MIWPAFGLVFVPLPVHFSPAEVHSENVTTDVDVVAPALPLPLLDLHSTAGSAPSASKGFSVAVPGPDGKAADLDGVQMNSCPLPPPVPGDKHRESVYTPRPALAALHPPRSGANAEAEAAARTALKENTATRQSPMILMRFIYPLLLFPLGLVDGAGLSPQNRDTPAPPLPLYVIVSQWCCTPDLARKRLLRQGQA